MARSVTQPMEMASVGRCIPSGLRGEPAAGDFFDVFALDGARTLIAVGDVVGHGLDAADRREVLRGEIRELAIGGQSIVEIMQQLDVLNCGRGPEELATLWLGIHDQTTDWLEYASAGHLPPILAGADGEARILSEASAPPLGTGHVDRHILVDRTRLTAGALLVAYTDGLIERAGLDLEHQIQALRGIVAELYVPALSAAALERLIDGVLRRLPTSSDAVPDDVCILAVHWPILPSQR